MLRRLVKSDTLNRGVVGINAIVIDQLNDRIGLDRMGQETAQDAAAQAASIVLAYRELISSTWLALLADNQESLDRNVVDDLADSCVLAFAGYLRGDDFGRTALAQQWNQLNPDRKMVGDATVSMSLFIEALRRACPQIPNCPLSTEEILIAAIHFVRRVTTGILHSIDLEPDDSRWAEVSRELEQQRRLRIARMAVLTDIARAVNTTQDLDDLFQQVYDYCTTVLNLDIFAISMYDEERDCVIPSLVYNNGNRLPEYEGECRPARLLSVVTETQEPLSGADYQLACLEHGLDPEPLFALSEQYAFVAAPMIQGGKAVGVIAVFSTQAPFSHEDVELLSAVARQTAVALENQRLIQSERRRVTQLKAVNQLAQRIVAQRDPEHLLTTTVDLIHEWFGYNLVSIFVHDADTNELRLQACSDRTNTAQMRDLRLTVGVHGIAGHVAASGVAALVNNVHDDQHYFMTPETASTQAEISVPIIRQGNVLGVLDIQSPERDAFDEHDLTTLKTIADQVALALENARLFREEQERSNALSLMLGTTRAAGSSLVLDEVLDRLAEGIAEAAGSSNCAIYLFDDEDQLFAPAVAYAPPNAKWDQDCSQAAQLSVDLSPLLQQLIGEQQPILCCNIPTPEFVGATLEPFIGKMPALTIPLVTRGRILGIALTVADTEQDSFSDEQIRLAQGVADSAALAIENARLYAESQGLAIAQERGRLAQEIHDGLAQGLTAISLQLDLADAYLPGKPDRAAERVRRALELTRINLEEARRSVLDLRMAQSHEVPLPDALRRLIQHFGSDANVHAEFGADGLTNRLSARVEMGLYRIAEEALMNIRRHASAQQVSVRLSAGDDNVTLSIQDDGVGFDTELALNGPRPGQGFGLVGIRERARLLRGSLQICSEPGEGTNLTVTVPFEASVRVSAESEDMR